jgi:hypothetical protein
VVFLHLEGTGSCPTVVGPTLVAGTIRLEASDGCLAPPSPFTWDGAIGPLPSGSYPVVAETLTATLVVLPATGTCVPTATVLCLQQGRFAVSATWEVDDGYGPQPAHAVPFTADSGWFWFFDSDNVEMVVKVLDGCAQQTPRYWVFASGLTNVGVVLSVTDTLHAVTQTYRSEMGSAFQPLQDTAAFATCP